MSKQPIFATILEILFHSPVRVALLRFFLEHPDVAWSIDDLCTRSSLPRRSVIRELHHLHRADVVLVDMEKEKGVDRAQKNVYRMNNACLIYPELRQLFIKARAFIAHALFASLRHTAGIRYLACSGFFVGDDTFPTDMIIVGRVNRASMQRMIKKMEREFHRELRYTIFSLSEFQYRLEVMDRFLYQLLEHPKKIIFINRLPVPKH